MSNYNKTIVLDANILIRAILGIKTFSLIVDYHEEVIFCTPEVCYDEVSFHIPKITQKRHLTPTEEKQALDTLNNLRKIVIDIEEKIYIDYKQNALNRIGERDHKDWSIVALALSLKCPIWTEDQDFFGIGIATWRTKNIEIFLNSS
ncbi:PIN domain-containing protein [Geminocystis sp. CENA526]|uniref:PIN domain-containing protein n=1 Tax=Geminocystis sp. CENA526 TaxID=1355871 RepID=UPI003D6FAB9C